MHVEFNCIVRIIQLTIAGLAENNSTFLLWQAAKPITTLNNQNCANILVNMEYILYLCVI